MKIGIAYDLRSEYLAMGYSEEQTAEFDREETIELLEKAIRDCGHATDRIGHARNLVRRLSEGDRWDLVFNICEGLEGAGREAQVPAILDAFGIPYTFSDPVVMGLTLHKAFAKRIVRDAGVPTAPFELIERERDLEKISFGPPYFAKPVAEGTSKGISSCSVVQEISKLRSQAARLLVEFHQPILVEQYLPGREFTVGILGTGEDAMVVGTLEVGLRAGAEKNVYSYVNKERCEELVDYILVSSDRDEAVRESERLALVVWRTIGCRDAGRVDFRCDESGKPRFLEVNPLAGLHPTHSDLPILCEKVGIPYVQLIGRIISSASSRIRARAEHLHV